MWGGRPIGEQINVTAAGASDGLGPAVASATSTATATGWCVFTQAGSMVLIPGGAYPPVASVGNYVSFFRYGSNARVAVACDPALVTTCGIAGRCVDDPGVMLRLAAKRALGGREHRQPWTASIASQATPACLAVVSNGLGSASP